MSVAYEQYVHLKFFFANELLFIFSALTFVIPEIIKMLKLNNSLKRNNRLSQKLSHYLTSVIDFTVNKSVLILTMMKIKVHEQISHPKILDL